MLVLCGFFNAQGMGVEPIFWDTGMSCVGWQHREAKPWLVLSHIHPVLCPGCAVSGDGELTLTRPEFPRTIKPVPASPRGCRLWLGTDGL